MAGTITWGQLRELAGFRAEHGCAVSLYLSLDPSEAPTAAGVETRRNSLLAAAERVLEERKKSLGHDQREALKADLERVAAWFDDGFDRDGMHGVAVFAAGLDNFWSTLALPDPVGDHVKIGGELYLSPLARIVGRTDGVLVAAVGRERGSVFRLEGGELVELADDTEEVPGRHDQGGWSQARYERHIDEIVERHWRRVAETLDRSVRTRHGARVVLVGAEDGRSEFEELLSHEVKSSLVGWTTAEAHADATQLLEAARPLLGTGADVERQLPARRHDARAARRRARSRRARHAQSRRECAGDPQPAGPRACRRRRRVAAVLGVIAKAATWLQRFVATRLQI